MLKQILHKLLKRVQAFDRASDSASTTLIVNNDFIINFTEKLLRIRSSFRRASPWLGLVEILENARKSAARRGGGVGVGFPMFFEKWKSTQNNR